METLIVGNGEIGKSLLSVLGEYYPCDIIDKEDLGYEDYEVMHICFPYSDRFKKYVKQYQDKYKPKYTVIHSTVPVGTSESLNAIHTPCVGIHPHLGESLTTFKKFIGGNDNDEVIQYFRRAGIRVYSTDKPDSTELMKILSTSFYGLCIEWNKEVKRLCDEHNIPFELWTLWTNNYNEGYNALGYPEYTRPNLIPMMGKKGGHCVSNNLKYLDSKFKEFIKDK